MLLVADAEQETFPLDHSGARDGYSGAIG